MFEFFPSFTMLVLKKKMESPFYLFFIFFVLTFFCVDILCIYISNVIPFPTFPGSRPPIS